MKRILLLSLLLALLASSLACAQPIVPAQARVAVLGDSITEQKIYSRFLEDYLLVCQPQLQTVSMQFGWSGDTARGMNSRVIHDVLPFKPTLVTTCYGMNDGGYRAFDANIGKSYEDPMREMVGKLKAGGALVVVGGPGAVDSTTFRNDPAQATIYNDNLRQLGEIARKIATENGFPFADVHGAMMDAMGKAKAALGNAYHVAGTDGVHPWANGHLVMAYAFLKAMGFDGDLGTISVDMKGPSTATGGHKVLAGENGKAEIESSRWPFCFTGAPTDPGGTVSILPFVPFNQDLNRLTLVVKNLDAAQAKVTWGDKSQVFPKDDLEKGLNLAAAFLDNPFSAPFQKLDAAVGQKEQFETYLIKNFVSPHGAVQGSLKDETDLNAATDSLHEKLWARQAKYATDVRAQIAPVKHTLTVEPA